MENTFLLLLVFIAYAKLIMDRLLWGVIVLLLLILPILITLLFERFSKRFNKKNDIKDFKYLFDSLVNMSGLIFLIFSVVSAMFPKDSNEANLNYILFNSLYYSLIIFTFIIINYYGTNSDKLKSSIKNFIESCKKFLKDKFLINVFALILIILFKNNDNLFLGFVVSYVFFLLTEITAIYNRKNKNKNNYNKMDIPTQIVINIALIYTIAQFDKIFIALANNKIPIIVYKDYIINILIFIVIIAFSNYKDYLISWYNTLEKQKSKNWFKFMSIFDKLWYNNFNLKGSY